MTATPGRAGKARAAVRVGLIVAGLTGATQVAGQSPAPPKPGAAPRATFAQISAEATRAREAGRIDEALALYRRGVAMQPAWDEGQWYLGALLYERGAPKAARAAFGKLLQRQPEHAGAVALSGLCAFQLGEYEGALRQLLRARQLNVQKTAEIATVVRYHTGLLLTRFGEFEAGNQVLSELAAEGQESPQVTEAFGVNLLRLPLLPAEVPADARPRVQLAGRAGFAMAARRAAEARELLEALVAAYGDVPHVQYVWGVFLLSEDPPGALQAFQQEIARSPLHVPARLQMVYELVKQGDPEAARPYAEQAVKIDPDQFGPHLAMGQVQLGLGRLDAAITSLEQAVRLAPGSAQPFYVLSVAYARAGREADAARARETFTRLSVAATRYK